MGEKRKITNGTYWSWWKFVKCTVAPSRQVRGRNSGCKKNQHREKILNADGQRTNVQCAGKSELMAQRLGIALLVLRANAGSAASRRRVQNYRQLKNAIFRNHCRYAVILFCNCLN